MALDRKTAVTKKNACHGYRWRKGIKVFQVGNKARSCVERSHSQRSSKPLLDDFQRRV